jgi:hypothetical protein
MKTGVLTLLVLTGCGGDCIWRSATVDPPMSCLELQVQQSSLCTGTLTIVGTNNCSGTVTIDTQTTTGTPGSLSFRADVSFDLEVSAAASTDGPTPGGMDTWSVHAALNGAAFPISVTATRR